MTGRTGYTAPTTASSFNPPADITVAYEHFDPLIGETVATLTDLPSSGNWQGRTITVLADASVTGVLVRVWDGSAWVTPGIAAPLTVSSGLTLPAGVTQQSGKTVVKAWLDRQVVFLEGAVTCTSAVGFSFLTLPSGFLPPATTHIYCDNGSFAEIATTGVASTTSAGARSLAFSGFFHL